jgi:hypothetical protein
VTKDRRPPLRTCAEFEGASGAGTLALHCLLLVLTIADRFAYGYFAAQ